MIRTIIVDDSDICVTTLKYMCEQFNQLNICGAFTTPLEALSYAEENAVDCAFLDIEMPQMNGIELGKQLREKHPHIVLIYVTSKEEYCSIALKMKADFYIFKPYEYADIMDAAERAQLLVKRKEQLLKANMFGRFDVFAAGEAIHFPNSKAKELLALCLDHRGGVVTMEEAIDKLWPEKPYDERAKRLYRKAVIALKTLLPQYTERIVFTNNRGSCKIIAEAFECDYFTLMDQKESREDFYELMDQYLEEYSWSEMIVSRYTMDWEE